MERNNEECLSSYQDSKRLLKRGGSVENNPYMNILIDTLTKKAEELDKILEITLLQEKYLLENPFSMEKFMKTVDSKQTSIERLDQLDNGFEKVYDHIKEEVESKPTQYKEQIQLLQNLIKVIMEKNAKIQALEKNNETKWVIYSNGKRKEIKEFKVSRRTAEAYNKNMPYQHYGQSCFFNKKK